MKTYLIIYFSLFLGVFGSHNPTPKCSFLPSEASTFRCDEKKLNCQHQEAHLHNCLVSCSENDLQKIVKKDTMLDIDMGYFPLPSCWSSIENGLQGPDSTIAIHGPLVYTAKLKTNYEATELLGHQAIVDNCIKEEIIPELFKTKSRIKNISFNEELAKRYQEHFSNLYPCSTLPVYFKVAILEDEDLKGKPGLSVLHFMIFEYAHGYVLHYSKNSLSAQLTNYERDKKDYLHALAHAEYFPEYVQKVREVQRQSTQDSWHQYNNQLLANLSYRHWRTPWEPGSEGDYRPWRRSRFGEHEKYLQYFNSNDTLSLYDPETDYNIEDSSWKELKSEDAKN